MTRQVATARSKIRAAAKILNEKIVAQERLKASEKAAKKSKESSDEKLFQVDLSLSIPKLSKELICSAGRIERATR